MDSELTPQNVETQLAVAPEILAADDAPTGDAFDVEGEPLGLDAAPGEDGDGASAAPPQEEGDQPESGAGDAAAELEALRREKAEFDRLRAEMAQQEQAMRQQQAAQWWQQQEAQASNYFAAREQQIYAQAQQQYDAPAYIRQEMARLNQQRSAWEAQYRQTREAAVWQFAAQAYVPQYAHEVADHYGLDQQARSELLAYAPDQMPRAAQMLAREQQARKLMDQARRSAAARTVAGASPAPGGGRATGGRIKAGSRAHLLALLSQ